MRDVVATRSAVGVGNASASRYRGSREFGVTPPPSPGGARQPARPPARPSRTSAAGPRTPRAATATAGWTARIRLTEAPSQRPPTRRIAGRGVDWLDDLSRELLDEAAGGTDRGPAARGHDNPTIFARHWARRTYTQHSDGSRGDRDVRTPSSPSRTTTPMPAACCAGVRPHDGVDGSVLAGSRPASPKTRRATSNEPHAVVGGGEPNLLIKITARPPGCRDPAVIAEGHRQRHVDLLPRSTRLSDAYHTGLTQRP